MKRTEIKYMVITDPLLTKTLYDLYIKQNKDVDGDVIGYQGRNFVVDIMAGEYKEIIVD